MPVSLEILQDETKQIPSVNFLATPDLTGAVTDVVTEFWDDPGMSIDRFIENTVSAMEAAG